jgi:hypothetical protein
MHEVSAKTTGKPKDPCNIQATENTGMGNSCVPAAICVLTVSRRGEKEGEIGKVFSRRGLLQMFYVNVGMVAALCMVVVRFLRIARGRGKPEGICIRVWRVGVGVGHFIPLPTPYPSCQGVTG